MKIRTLAAVLAAFFLTGPAVAAARTPARYFPRPHARCRTNYRREHVRVDKTRRVRRHGRTVTIRVREHGRLVKVWRVECVYHRPVHTTPTGSAPTISYGTQVDPSFTQAPTNPLAVTYSYSASATETVDGVTEQMGAEGDLPDGVLNFYSATTPGGTVGLVCSMNVGGSTAGGSCPVAYTATGAYQVTTEYIPDGVTAVTQSDSETISPFATATTETVSATSPTGPFGAYSIDITPSVVDQNANPLTPSGQEMQITVVDSTNGTTGIWTGSGAMSLNVQRDDGAPGEVNGGQNYSQTGGDMSTITRGDSLQITAAYVGAPGYSGSTSAPAQYVAGS